MTVTLTAFRLASWDTPLWVAPNRSAGRWNHELSAPTQYLSLHPLGPWAELLRARDLRDPALAATVAARTWALRVEVAEPPLELTWVTAAGHGLSPADLVADDQRPCRELAQRWRDDPRGPRAFTAPSAALPGTRSLVLLGPRVASPWEVTLLDPDREVAAGCTADAGHAPEPLASLVRFRGTAHAEHDAWARGESFTPPVGLLGEG